MSKEVAANIIIERMRTASRSHNKAALAGILGIKPASITTAERRNKVPGRWFVLIEEKFGVSKEELCRPTKKVEGSLDIVYGCAPTLIQDGSGNAQGNSKITYGSAPAPTETMPKDIHKLMELIQELRSPMQIRKMIKELEQEREEFGG